MKKLLIAFTIIVCYCSCKKSQQGLPVDIYNPTPGSPADVIEKSMIGTWKFVSSSEIYYDAAGKTIYEYDQTGANSPNYLIFETTEPGIPALVKSNTTGLLTDFGSDAAYILIVKNGLDYLDRFTQVPSDGYMEQIIFSDSKDFKLINTSIILHPIQVGNVTYNPSSIIENDLYTKIN